MQIIQKLLAACQLKYNFVLPIIFSDQICFFFKAKTVIIFKQEITLCGNQHKRLNLNVLEISSLWLICQMTLIAFLKLEIYIYIYIFIKQNINLMALDFHGSHWQH